MIEEAMGYKFNVITTRKSVTYLDAYGHVLFDTEIDDVDEMRAILFLEGRRKQKEANEQS